MDAWMQQLPFAAGVAVTLGLCIAATILLLCLTGCLIPCVPWYGFPKDLVQCIREEWAEKRAKRRAKREARKRAKEEAKKAAVVLPDAITVDPPPTAATAPPPPAVDTGSTNSKSKSNSSDLRGTPPAVSTSIFESQPRARPPPPAALPTEAPNKVPLPASAQAIDKAAAVEEKPAPGPSKELTLMTARAENTIKILDKTTGKVASGVSADALHAAIEEGLQRERKDDESVDDVRTDWGTTQPMQKSGEEESGEKKTVMIPSERTRSKPSKSSLMRSKESRGRETTGSAPE